MDSARPADQAATDQAATDKAVTDQAVTDQAVTDTAVTDTAVTDNAARAPDLVQIEQIARDTLNALPRQWRLAAAEVALRVEDFASDEILQEMDLDDPFDLTGLYDGVPLTEKSVMDQPLRPDTIWLFRRPILDEWVERGNVGLAELVAHVTIHELAHHFGWSDAEIAAIAPWWD